MEITKTLTNIMKGASNRIKEFQKPVVEERNGLDRERIKREVSYAKRLKTANPRLNVLNKRRQEIKIRRTRP